MSGSNVVLVVIGLVLVVFGLAYPFIVLWRLNRQLSGKEAVVNRQLVITLVLAGLVPLMAVLTGFWLMTPIARASLVYMGALMATGLLLVGTLLAMNPDSRVLDLVGYAWAGFGAAFGPIIILSLFWRRMTRNGAAAGLVVGAVTVVVWKQLSGGLFDLYEIVPGFILCWLAVVVVSRAGEPSARVLADYDKVADARANGRAALAGK